MDIYEYEKSEFCVFCSFIQKLQGAAEELQSIMGDVLAASKPLIGQLEPLPANLIRSETRLLSRGILLLNKAIAEKKRSVEVREVMWNILPVQFSFSLASHRMRNYYRHTECRGTLSQTQTVIYTQLHFFECAGGFRAT